MRWCVLLILDVSLRSNLGSSDVRGPKRQTRELRAVQRRPRIPERRKLDRPAVNSPCQRKMQTLVQPDGKHPCEMLRKRGTACRDIDIKDIRTVGHLFVDDPDRSETRQLDPDQEGEARRGARRRR